MKNLTRIVLLALAAAVLVLTVAVLTPRKAHATGMTTDPTLPRTPWSGTCNLIPTSATSAAATCNITTVPSNAELVIQSEVFNAITSDADTPELPSITATTGGVGTEVWFASATSTSVLVDGKYVIHLTQAIPFYADAGSVILCGAIVPHHGDFVSQTITLSGYYVSPT